MGTRDYVIRALPASGIGMRHLMTEVVGYWRQDGPMKGGCVVMEGKWATGIFANLTKATLKKQTAETITSCFHALYSIGLAGAIDCYTTKLLMQRCVCFAISPRPNSLVDVGATKLFGRQSTVDSRSERSIEKSSFALCILMTKTKGKENLKDTLGLFSIQ
ncbi:hypothetical protein EVAR_45731_1 [Eumeta japonica]|uniref:Uncharacterized protein n=1 Tax=Eumeta variegata TaxID=151549 RepID=A0A4C1WVF1_EUMVA|nr:hypothetical protein EVAR_45731_1 [Eumeta japonica]